MQKTNNYGLNKPDGSDEVNISVLNDNMDIVDKELYKKVDKEQGKGLSEENFTAEEKRKLKNIGNEAEKNKVLGVKGENDTEYKEGYVNITKSSLGLENVDNTPDAKKEVLKAKESEMAKDTEKLGGYSAESFMKKTDMTISEQTLECSHVTSGSIVIQKTGSMCIVNFKDVLFDTSGSEIQICQGLPAAISETRAVLSGTEYREISKTKIKEGTLFVNPYSKDYCVDGQLVYISN